MLRATRVTTTDADILAPDGSIEARICSDCQVAQPIDNFQRRPKSDERVFDCKNCRRAKYEKGRDRNTGADIVVTKAWIIEEAKKLYHRAERDSDKAKYLELISRNVNDDGKKLTDDAKVVKDLIASKKKMQEMGK